VMRATMWSLLFIQYQQPMGFALMAGRPDYGGGSSGSCILAVITLVAVGGYSVLRTERGLLGLVGRYALETAFLLRPFSRQFALAAWEQWRDRGAVPSPCAAGLLRCVGRLPQYDLPSLRR